MEILYERVHSIWSRAVLSNVPGNLCVVNGEALTFLRQCVSPGTVSQLYVNFPDPPAWEGSKRTLISQEFLTACHSALEVGGTVVVVTDNSRYAAIIEKELPNVKHLYQPTGESWCSPELPQDYGTSYFDELWKNGKFTDRFFFSLRKIVSKKS